MKRGFLLGKFMPPHLGHLTLCRYAIELCDQLTVLVCSRDCEPIPGRLRYSWMKELLPKALVLHLHRDIPQEPSDHPGFWRVWRDAIREYHPEPITHVFASESYGHQLAAELGGLFVPADPNRLGVPVSASQIRANPYTHWEWIPDVVRPHYLKRVCLFGPESTGKTTLAKRLADCLGTVSVPEYGRVHTEQFGTKLAPDDLPVIAQRQQAMAVAMERLASRVLILDTDPVLTAVWSTMLHQRQHPWFAGFGRHADLYLLLGTDAAWVDDGTRYFPAESDRRRFDQLSEQELKRRGLRYLRLSGDWDEKLAQALDATSLLFSEVGAE